MKTGKAEIFFIVVALLVSLLMAAMLSPWASSLPDGLEKVAQQLGFVHRAEEKSVWEQSPMPDYTLPGVKNQAVSTGLAGVLGTAAVFIVAMALGLAVVKLRRRKRV